MKLVKHYLALLACAVLVFVYFGLRHVQPKSSKQEVPKKKSEAPKHIFEAPERKIDAPKKNFVILDWSPAYFSKENGLPINVDIGNCLVTRDRHRLLDSDAVMIEVRGIPNLKDMPQQRLPWQRWVYFNVESPYFAMLEYAGRYKMSDFTGKLAFNWTMTYRSDADVPVLYGSTLKKSKAEESKTQSLEVIVKRKTKLVSAMTSNCVYVKNNRAKYVKELQKHIGVDFYGDCGTLKCEGHYKTKPCQKLKDYKFFLTFENSNCRDYITEKIFMQAYESEAVPVVLGAYKEDYVRLVPPNSFIHVADFSSPKKLAEYLNQLDKNNTAYLAYHKWRRNYKVEYNFRLLQDIKQPWRLLCGALNKKHNESAKWYGKLTDFENPDKDCYQEEWLKHH